MEVKKAKTEKHINNQVVKFPFAIYITIYILITNHMDPVAPSLVPQYSFISYMAPSVRLWSPMALFSSHWYNLWSPLAPLGL